jgi:dTDP-4-dehydrorhamnose reductase
MILITGANGQLGYDFQRLFDSLEVKYIATDVADFDITNEKSIDDFFLKHNNISLIINCAAYNDVDKAETDSDFCMLLNSRAPFNLAKKAKEIGATFVTYSTDFVFDGDIRDPYTEEDMPNPPSVYAKSKRMGEEAVLAEYDKSFVIRTSWVFGIANNNFNKQVINWSKTRDELNIVDDQISVPTYSKDLAYFSWKLIETKKYGLYHMSNSGICSKYDQAKYVLDKIGWTGKLGTSKTEDFNLPAKRSKFSKLDSTKLENIVGEKIPSWQDAIDRFLEELN